MSDTQYVCAFCGEPVAYDNANLQIQVVFDGIAKDGDKRYVKKRAGKVLAVHQVCELPKLL